MGRNVIWERHSRIISKFHKLKRGNLTRKGYCKRLQRAQINKNTVFKTEKKTPNISPESEFEARIAKPQ